MGQISTDERLKKAVEKIHLGWVEIQSLYDEVEASRGKTDKWGSKQVSTLEYQDLQECEKYLETAHLKLESVMECLESVRFWRYFERINL